MLWKPRHRRSGISIVELMVSSGLVLLLLGELWMLLQTGTKFYLRVRGQTEVQRQALFALRWLSKDLSEGAPLSFRHYNPDNPSITTVRNGLAFGSPKNANGQVTYNPQGRIEWHSVLGYFIDPESNNFLRTQYILPTSTPPTPATIAPQINDDEHHVDLLATSSLEKRVIAQKIVDIETEQAPGNVKVVLKFRDEEMGFGLSVETRLEMKNK